VLGVVPETLAAAVVAEGVGDGAVLPLGAGVAVVEGEADGEVESARGVGPAGANKIVLASSMNRLTSE
jgi:hypothetical protein